MSEILEVSGDWLALREPEDAMARSMEVARRAAELLPDAPLVIHDLGSGTGSMMRWLAPYLPGPQTWMLHDWNAHLTEQALTQPRPRSRDGVEVSAVARVGNLAGISATELAGASLVTASALLDVLTSAEVHALVSACVAAGCPALLSLSVTGKVRLSPRDELDAAINDAFNAHQLRDANSRRQLGRYAAPIARGLFAEAGWSVRQVTTLWHLDHRQSALLREWFDGWLDAAIEQRPELSADAQPYRARRLAQLERGDLSARVDHVDILAWPGAR